jgi:uncharacterized membrane protein YcjF (UPF0283 family)
MVILFTLAFVGTLVSFVDAWRKQDIGYLGTTAALSIMFAAEIVDLLK